MRFSIDNYDISNSELSNLIDEYIHNEKHRQMLKSRLIDGVIFEQLAEMYDLSVMHTYRIIYKEQDRLFKRLEKYKGGDGNER